MGFGAALGLLWDGTSMYGKRHELVARQRASGSSATLTSSRIPLK
jgi:hypothetical protein